MNRYRIVSGGQTGVDRAALDIAIELGIDYGGWCPRGGWAEDLSAPPGLLAHYPKLKETPLANVEQRTRRNVRDSDGTLILVSGTAASEGTDFTVACAEEFKRSYLVLDVSRTDDVVKEANAWLGDIHTLNIAGPRESEAPGIYAQAKVFLRELFR